jgi:hypothetical protein
MWESVLLGFFKRLRVSENRSLLFAFTSGGAFSQPMFCSERCRLLIEDM